MRRNLWAALLAAACGSACASVQPDRAPETAALAACSAPAGLAEARCSTLNVPENRAVRGGRTIPLRIAVVPGEAGSSVGPLFVLAGGPGQGAVEQGPSMLATLKAIHKGDIVLVDQRGTGASNGLNCEGGFGVMDRGSEAKADACLAGLSKIADLRLYGTPEAVQDLEAVRRALGYDRINLFGISYGTRVAGAYMRAHPGRVRSAMMRAAAPPDFNILSEGAANADAEIDRMFSECEADPVCAADFPGVRGQLAALRARLKRAPETVAAPGGEPLVVTTELFNSTLYVMLLSAQSRQRIPRMVADVSNEGFGSIAPVMLQVSRAVYGGVPVGMYLSVVCSEDAPRVGPEALNRDGDGVASGTADVVELCARWPNRPPPASFYAPLRVTTPTLIITGANDPATTIPAARRLEASLPRAKHLVVPATAHGPPIPTCVQSAVTRFLATATVEGLEADCSAMRLPAFTRAKAAAAKPG